MLNEPLVSIGIPTYNRSQSLRIAIDSVINQNYTNLEIIISDNASVDDTEDVCKNYVQSDNRIKYFKQSVNKGPTANFEFVKENASGTYFMWLGDDDYLDINYIQKCVTELENDTSIQLVSGLAAYHNLGVGPITHYGNIIQLVSNYTFLRMIKYLSCVADNSVFCGIYRKETIEYISIPNVLAGDWIWVLYVLLKGKAKVFENILVHRSYGENTSSSIATIVQTIGAPKWQISWPWLAMALNTAYFINKQNEITVFERKIYAFIVLVTILSRGTKIYIINFILRYKNGFLTLLKKYKNLFLKKMQS